MKINSRNIAFFIAFLGIILPETILGQSYYNRFEYRRKRHEVTFGGGASSCLTDLGGRDAIGSGFLWDMDIAKTSYVINFSYLYSVTSKIVLRLNGAYSNLSGDDFYSEEYYRNNRRLNFETSILEGSGMVEIILRNVRTGNRYNLKTPAGKFIGARNPIGIGVYLFAGVGGFFFDPTGHDRFIDKDGNIVGSGTKYRLRELHTEGQGLDNDPAGFASGTTYSPIALCVPMGFGFKKAFSGNGGIKLEAGFRFTSTDYIDDVSQFYYDKSVLAANYGADAATMSGTGTGIQYDYVGYAIDGVYPPGSVPAPHIGGTDPYTMNNQTHTKPGDMRGNPDNDDSYMFVTLSAYKKFNNASKSYRTINVHQKRKIKASF